MFDTFGCGLSLDILPGLSPILGDFNGNLVLDGPDMDLLFAAQAGPLPPAHPFYDLDGDGVVNRTPNTPGSDADYWVRQMRSTDYGDANLDGQVTFDDLLVLSQNYGNSGGGWSQGNLDGVSGVNFGDLLLLTQHYGVKGSVDPQVGDARFRNDSPLAVSLTPEPLSRVWASRCCFWSRGVAARPSPQSPYFVDQPPDRFSAFDGLEKPARTTMATDAPHIRTPQSSDSALLDCACPFGFIFPFVTRSARCGTNVVGTESTLGGTSSGLPGSRPRTARALRRRWRATYSRSIRGRRR